MQANPAVDQPRFRAYGRKHLEKIPRLKGLSADQRLALRTVSTVLPFRVNQYIVNELIDWDDIPSDPIYQLTFPQAGMLDREDFNRIRDLLVNGASEQMLRSAARRIQVRMNPHPSGQMEFNVPTVDGEPLVGSQHKYRETLLFFPGQGQTCHAFCTYCFRWAQFVGIDEIRFAAGGPERMVRYLRRHPEISDVLITGGDPLIMSTKVLRRYVEPLLKSDMESVRSIRIGTKAPAYWPYRFLTDRDADDLLRLFEEIRESGRHLALMVHYSHPRELEPPAARAALRRIIGSGATVRCQAPLIRHVNDSADIWAALWQREVELGAVPYYIFVERDTGPHRYFEVPLARAQRIYSQAQNQVSGLARTARGPSMSAVPGKVVVEGATTINGERVFVLKMLQGRDPSWVNRVFFARFDSQATWLDQLEPALGEESFFYDEALQAMQQGRWRPEWDTDAGLQSNGVAG